MATRIQLRRDTAANWSAANPVLASGEAGIELDTKGIKIGDGTTAWNSLDYASISPGLTGVISSSMLTTTGVTPGTYNEATVTVDASGRITAVTGIARGSVTLDFGTVPVYGKTVTFNHAAAKTTSDIWLTVDPTSDEAEMDSIIVAAHCKTDGVVTCYINSHPGPIVGSRTFTYNIV